MSYSVYRLHTIAENMGLKPLRNLAQRSEVRAVYRLTIQRRDTTLCDSVATLCLARVGGTVLETVFQGAFNHKPMSYPIPAARYELLIEALQNVRFDHLRDMPDLPPYGVEIWLLERAAGTFVKGVILSPDENLLAQKSAKPYIPLITAIRAHLPEAVREMKR